MKEALTFIKGSIASTGTITEHRYVSQKDGMLQSFNGVTFATHPLKDVDDFLVEGAKLFKACSMCKWSHETKITKARLIIKKGKFNVRLPLTDIFDRKELDKNPETLWLPLPKNLLGVLKALQPFMSRDASRPWSTSILIKGGVAVTTNNVVIIFKECEIPDMVIPADMVDLLLSIKENPVSVSTDNGLTFCYDDGAWVYCTGTKNGYPDFTPLMEKKLVAKNSEGFQESVQKLIAFDPDGFVTMKDGVLSNGEASIDGFDCGDFAFHATPLSLVWPVLKSIDTTEPAAPFVCSGMYGVICQVAV